jgi:hypothetical protein
MKNLHVTENLDTFRAQRRDLCRTLSVFRATSVLPDLNSQSTVTGDFVAFWEVVESIN